MKHIVFGALIVLAACLQAGPASAQVTGQDLAAISELNAPRAYGYELTPDAEHEYALRLSAAGPTLTVMAAYPGLGQTPAYTLDRTSGLIVITTGSDRSLRILPYKAPVAWKLVVEAMMRDTSDALSRASGDTMRSDMIYALWVLHDCLIRSGMTEEPGPDFTERAGYPHDLPGSWNLPAIDVRLSGEILHISDRFGAARSSYSVNLTTGAMNGLAPLKRGYAVKLEAALASLDEAIAIGPRYRWEGNLDKLIAVRVRIAELMEHYGNMSALSGSMRITREDGIVTIAHSADAFTYRMDLSNGSVMRTAPNGALKVLDPGTALRNRTLYFMRSTFDQMIAVSAGALIFCLER